MSEYCHILLIEDDQWLREGLTQFLVSKGFRVSAVGTLQSARLLMINQQPSDQIHMIVSDVSLPDGLALDFVNELYAQEHIGKLFISASVSEQDRVAGLKVGADDYLCKPIYPEELFLRIKSVLRRLNISCDDKANIKFLHYQLDPESRILSFEHQQVQLSNAEHQLLIQLIARQGKIVSREHLFSTLDNAEIYQLGRALDILVSRLRKKMQGGNSGENPIITYRGKGYMLLLQN